MKTVKEVSELTGISIRALRYYDESVYLFRQIGLTQDIGFMMIML